jgi:hypothetical protein
MLKFHETVVFIGSFVLIVTFVFSLMIRATCKSEPPLNYFFIVPLIGILSSVNAVFTNILILYGIQLGGFIERVLVMFDLLFWVYFFHKIGIRVISKRKYEILVFVVISAIIALIFMHFRTNNYHHYIVSMLLIIELALCLIYINTLFSRPPIKLLIKNPIFLIVAGLLIKCALAIPTHLVSEIMYVTDNKKIYQLIFPVSNIAILLMYAHFIYALYCIKSEHDNIAHLNPEIQNS